MKILIIGLTTLGLFACEKSNFSGKLGACKSVYETTNSSIVINDSSLSPFCIVTGLDYEIDVSNLSLSNVLWNTGDSTNVISIDEAGTYEGFGINNNNDTILFNYEAIDCQEHIYIPNTFTPNGDGQNDNFKPYFQYSTVCLEDYKLSIFDSYHQLVFSTNSFNPWNGEFKGVKSPVGVYHFILHYKREDGEAFEKTGQLLMMY